MLRLTSLIATLLLIPTTIFVCWWYSPEIVKSLIEDELQDSNVQLVSFSMRRPNTWQIDIDKLVLESAGNLVALDSLVLHPLPASDVSVSIASIIFTIQQEGPDSSDPLSWREALSLLDAGILLLPRTGKIESLSYCAPTCHVFDMHWSRHDDRLDAQLFMEGLNLMISLAISSRERGLSIYGQSDYLVLIDAVIEAQSELLTGAATGHLVMPERRFGLTAEGDIAGRFELSAASFKVDLSLPVDETVALASLQQAAGTASLDLNLLWQINWQDVRINGSRQLAIEGNLQQQILSIQNSLPVLLSIESPYLENLLATVDADSRCDLDVLGMTVLDCTLTRLDASASYEDFGLLMTGTDTALQFEGNQFDITSKLALTVDQTGSRLLEGDFDLHGTDTRIAITSLESSLLGLPFTVRIEQVLDSGKGSMSLRLNHKLRQMTELQTYLGLEVIEVNSGEMNIMGQYAWTPGDEFKLTQMTDIQLDGAGFVFDGYVFDDLDLHASFEHWPVMKTVQPADLTLKALNIGVPLTDIALSFDADINVNTRQFFLHGRSFDGQIFGGRIHASQFNYDSTTQLGTSLVELEGLELGEVLALQRQDLSSEGALSGSVPVQIKDGNLSVSNGYIEAIAPGGFIRYQPDATVVSLAKDNAGLKVVLDAMTDFQYHSLSAKLNYSPEGLMTAETGLKGSNPGYQGGREVHLNLTLEENLNTLLESLRLGADIADKVSQKTAKGAKK